MGITYFETGEAKVTDLNLQIAVDQYILALNVTVHDA